MPNDYENPKYTNKNEYHAGDGPFQFPWWAIVIAFVVWWPLGLVFIGLNAAMKNGRLGGFEQKAREATRDRTASGAKLVYNAEFRPIYDTPAQPQPKAAAPHAAPQQAQVRAAGKKLKGAALATGLTVAGVLLQAVMKNPLADPGIIGVSSGASLTAVLITAFVPTLYFFTPLFAFLGGMIAFLLVYSLSWKGGLSPLRIILVGVAVNAMFTGLMSAFNSGTGSNYSGVASIVNANITMKTWDDFQTLLLYVVIGLIASVFVMGQCNLLALEDKTARSLGVNVTRSRIVISVIAVLLASISTAVIGPISFLGLIVPHIARLLVGSNHKVLVPYSILLGAFTLLLADTVGRTIAAPYEISASIIMSVVGGPFFILLLRRSRQSYGQ